MKKTHPPVHQIEMRIAELPQLFNSMDPTPFHHRGLDDEAERFLETWAFEFPQDSHFRIVVHIEKRPHEDAHDAVREAIHNHFIYKAMLEKRRLRTLLLEGRISLLVGLGFLGLCLLGAEHLSDISSSAFVKVLKESLVIGGWVAMWRPMQIFLYEWWPMVRRTRIYVNLSRANVHVSPIKTER
jgi:hypothetical protein